MEITMTPLEKPVKCSNGLGRMLLVPTLFVALIILSKFGLAPLNSQWHTVIIVLFIYLIFLPFVFHNAFYTTCKAKKQLHSLEDDIHGYLSAHQFEFQGVKKSIGSVEHFFENFEHSLRNDHFANVAAGVFPTLGILGTFISIAISMPDFSVETSQALEAEISKLLSGVGTAFYASIFGIFLSLWWIFFEKSGLSQIDAIINDLRMQTNAKIWSDDELKLIEFKRQDRIQSATESVAEGLNTEPIQEEMRNIYNAYATLNKAVTRLSQNIQTGVDENLELIARSSQQIEKLVYEMTRQSSDQTQLHKRFEKLLMLQESFTDSSQAVAKSNIELLQKVQEIDFDRTLVSLHEYSSIIYNNTKKLSDYTLALQEARQEQQGFYNDQMHEGFKLIDKEVAHVIEKLSQVAIEMAALSTTRQ